MATDHRDDDQLLTLNKRNISAPSLTSTRRTSDSTHVRCGDEVDIPLLGGVQGLGGGHYDAAASLAAALLAGLTEAIVGIGVGARLAGGREGQGVLSHTQSHRS